MQAEKLSVAHAADVISRLANLTFEVDVELLRVSWLNAGLARIGDAWQPPSVAEKG